MHLALQAADGSALGARQVQVSALVPTPTGDLRSQELAVVRTGRDGSVDTTIPEDLLPQASHFPVELVLSSRADEAGMVYDFDAERSGDTWKLVLPDGTNAAAVPAAGRRATLRAGRGLVATEGADTSATTATSSTSGAMDAGSGEIQTSDPADSADNGDPFVTFPRGLSATSCASPYTMMWEQTGEFRYRYVPTKYVRTLGHSSFRWTYQRSHETSLGIAFNANGSKYAGGLSGARAQSSGLTFKPLFGNNVRQVWKIEYKYQKWHAYCYYSEIEQPTSSYYLNLYKWAPDSLPGGSRRDDTVSTFNCGGTGPNYVSWVGAETSVATSSVVNYNNWFSIIGVNLDARSSDGNYEEFTVMPDPGDNAKLCGDNTVPLYANLVKELPQ